MTSKKRNNNEKCIPGFHGERCELQCPPGYEGENCERRQFVECSITDCLNGGVCSKGSCRCPPGFTGDRCEKKSDPCKYHNCPQNAICIPTNNGATYKCECKLGFYGHDCKLEVSINFSSYQLKREISQEYKGNQKFKHGYCYLFTVLL